MERISAQTIAWAGVMALVFLLLGTFMAGILLAILPQSNYKDFVYSTGTNTTAGGVNDTTQLTHYANLSTLATIGGGTPSEYLIITTQSSNASNISLAVNLNGVAISNITALAGVTSNVTVTGLTFQNQVNNVTFNSTAKTDYTVNITNTYWIYPSSTTNRVGGAGGMYDIIVPGLASTSGVVLAAISLFAVFALLAATGMMGGGGGSRVK